jgi:hypothetical protein
VREGGMTAGAGSSAPGDRWRLALLVACLLISLALYAAFAVILGSVPPGWNSPLGFSLESGPMFRSFTGLPFVALSPAGFHRALVTVLVLLWLCWGAGALALRSLSSAELRRRAVVVAIAGGAAMLALVVVCAPTVLSSDLYRQGVYGRMVAYHGLNPYAAPVNAVPNDPLFALANHRHLTTHYGAAYTLLSALCALIAPSTALGGAIAWKAMSAAAALGCALLAGPVVRALGGTEADGQNAQLWLAWNPLLIVESGASGHIEPIMMLPALAGILFWSRGRPVRGVVALAVSTLTKWMTGLLVPFAIVREVYRAEPGRRLRSLLRLAGAAGLTIALLYAPFIGGLAKRGGISDIALRGAATVGTAPLTPLPQWALLAGFAALVLGTMRFVARGDWPRLIATTSTLLLVFVLIVNPWPFPWYYLSPVVLAAVLPRGRSGFVVRALSAGIGAMTMLLYTRLVPWAP